MLATVKNVSKQPVTLILDHPAFHTKEAGWQRTTAQFANYTGDGARLITEVRRTYPAALTIFPGKSVEDLHAAVVNCSQVPTLIARRVLTVTFSDDEETQE